MGIGEYARTVASPQPPTALKGKVSGVLPNLEV